MIERCFEEMEAGLAFDPFLSGKGKNESRGYSMSNPGWITPRFR